MIYALLFALPTTLKHRNKKVIEDFGRNEKKGEKSWWNNNIYNKAQSVGVQVVDQVKDQCVFFSCCTIYEYKLYTSLIKVRIRVRVSLRMKVYKSVIHSWSKRYSFLLLFMYE